MTETPPMTRLRPSAIRSLATVLVMGVALTLLTGSQTWAAVGRSAGAVPAAARVSVPLPPKAVAPKLLGGISVGDTLPWLAPAELDRQLRDFAELGVRSVRIDVAWRDVQPDDRNRYSWARLDRVVSRARVYGLQILGVLAYTPAWARPAGCVSDKCAPADPARFGAFARAAATRYAPQGIHTWEIWNEQNTTGFWKPTPDATAYARLVAATAPLIRKADPSAVIVSGGMAAVSTGRGQIGQLDFLDQMLKAGVAASVDAIGYHPYTYPFPASYRATWATGTAWNKMRDTSTSFASIFTRRGVSKPVWITEYGAPTGGPGVASSGKLTNIPAATDHVTEQWQAVIAADAVRTAAVTPGLGAFFWYGYRDFNAGGSNEGFYGLRRANGTAKPAWASISAEFTKVKNPSAR
jgi:hypothetical protein